MPNSEGIRDYGLAASGKLEWSSRQKFSVYCPVSTSLVDLHRVERKLFALGFN